MHAIFAGLTTLDVIHLLDHVPDVTTKTTSTHHAMSAGGPATNAAVTFASLEALRHELDGDGHTSAGGVTSLLSAIGTGSVARSIAADLADCAVTLIDATSADSPVQSPAISSIVEHPGGRMVASTNARITVDPSIAASKLSTAVEQLGQPDVVLVDGHNPQLANIALQLGISEGVSEDEDPFARIEARPSHLRILDGGSWKNWFLPYLSFVDIAIVSADFCPPVLSSTEGSAVADFLKGFGITRTIRTRGADPVQWFWDGESGEVEVPQVQALSTLGAGDAFHGAFAWALATAHESSLPVPPTPEGFIDFASRVAAVSTTHFGTRTWRTDPHLRDILAAFTDTALTR